MTVGTVLVRQGIDMEKLKKELYENVEKLVSARKRYGEDFFKIQANFDLLKKIDNLVNQIKRLETN